MSKTICLYLHVHQPWRVRHYGIFDIGANHVYFNDETPGANTNNEFVVQKVAHKSYLPTNAILQELLDTIPEFRLSLSITGTLIEQLRSWAPEALESFRKLVGTGRVEILAETYHHSLAFFYSRGEFEAQVARHSQLIKDEFGVTPSAFRNTELSYNNDLAYWADKAGYKAVLAEGWDANLGWRSPNFLYRPAYTDSIKLLLKNYRLSDDIAFRFSDQDWEGWPLTAEKYVQWLNALPAEQKLINLFMDYETFGEHQWDHSGIFDFLKALPFKWLETTGNRFLGVTEAAGAFEPADFVDTPQTTTWADTDRDLSAWLGNRMQQEALTNLYDLEPAITQARDADLTEDWRKLQISDHFYYMCTKWFADGDVHAYFSPYATPYEAFINFMNAVHDLRYRLAEKGLAP